MIYLFIDRGRSSNAYIIGFDDGADHSRPRLAKRYIPGTPGSTPLHGSSHLRLSTRGRVPSGSKKR